jgi:hypothetical protein
MADQPNVNANTRTENSIFELVTGGISVDD